MKSRQEFEQEQYEDVLSAHWHKCYQLKELKDNENNNPLRLKSIQDRECELLVIEQQKAALEQLGDWLIAPDWYIERMKELTK
jgi:hypothetical protein